MKKRSGRASQNQHHETLIYVVKNAQTHAVPMGKALHEARVYRTTERCWLTSFFSPRPPQETPTATGRVGQVLRVVILDPRDGGVQQPTEERIIFQG